MVNDLTEIKNRILSHRDTTRVKIRFNNTDAMGIVHFKNYMVYFDDGFVSFMNSIRGNKPVEQYIYEGIGLGVKHVNITYENPAKFGDYILVKKSIEKVGNKTFTFSHELFRESDNERVAVVKATRFIMDIETKKLIDVLVFFKEFLE
ncbi:MAG: acyl-CoA thioesterase [Candidatus Lokiarchaeota archaeon]|jgi:acyl-CoA thioester hydrolase